LLADDDDTFRFLVAECFKRSSMLEQNATLNCVSDGADAVEYVFGRGRYEDRGAYPAPDIVLLDERMGRMDGSEALAQIKSNGSALLLPICMLSSAMVKKWKVQCIEGGATFCVRKPLDFESLENKITLIVSFFREVVELPEA
jgi:two-component system response regulator